MTPSDIPKLGILAGGGDLPNRLVAACLSQGRPVFVLALEGHCDTPLPDGTDTATVRVGALGEAFRLLKEAGVKELVLAGRVRRPTLAEIRPDWQAARVLARIGINALGDDGLLRAIVGEIEAEGFRVVGADSILNELLIGVGPLGTFTPDAEAKADIARGVSVATTLGALDVGQAVIVQQGLVLGVEAVEGTEALIARSGLHRRDGVGGVLVKLKKPAQDGRIDLPTIGVATLEQAAAAGLRGIAVTAGGALVIDHDTVAARANDLGLFVVGISDQESHPSIDVPTAYEKPPLVFIVSGEPSGDVLAARLMQALRLATGGNVRFMGVGGESMAAQGLESLTDIKKLAVMGIVEVVPRIPHVLKTVKKLVDIIERERPAVVITVDSWGFTGRLNKALRAKKLGIPQIHYVAPMVWVWKEKRAVAVAHAVDHLLCLLPQEPPYFEKHGLTTTHVGHPVVEGGAGEGDGPAFRAQYGIAPDVPLVVVLPGSRHAEVSRLLPIFAGVVAEIAKRHPTVRIVVPTVATVADEVEYSVATWPGAPVVVRGEAARYAAFAAAASNGMAIAASGTVSLELARAGVPHLIAYRLSSFTIWLLRRLTTQRFANLINWLLNREAIPEFLQEDCTVAKLSEAALRLLTDDTVRATQRAAFAEALPRLAGGGEGTPSGRAAQVIVDLLHKAAT